MSGGTGSTSAGPSGCVHTHLQPQLTPHPRPREPRSPPVPSCGCHPPPARCFQAWICPSPKPWFGAFWEGSRWSRLRHTPQPPSYLVSLRPALEECAGPVPTAAAGEGRPQRSPPRAVVPAAATLVPRKPRPPPSISISIPTLGMARASGCPRGRGPDERLLETCHYCGGVRQDE